MSALTEVEIIDCLKTNFRLAAGHCEDLARLPARGPTYTAFRKELKLIEGAARQLAYWREDARWLQVGLTIEEAHKRAGHWLRRHYPRPLFLKLAENLRAGLDAAERLQHGATGRAGVILPRPVPSNHTSERSVQVLMPSPAPMTRGGLLLPPGFRPTAS